MEGKMSRQQSSKYSRLEWGDQREMAKNPRKNAALRR
jgi:hypothetical protein